MTQTVWLLDIDGVLNANKPGWGGPPRRTNVAGFVIRWAPPLIDRIRALHRGSTVEVRWSSTWCGEPADLAVLARLLRLDLEPAFGDRDESKTWAAMKAEAAVAVLAEGHRLVWTDDDEVGIAQDFYPEFAEAERDGRALLIAPRSNRGLQPDHMEAIEAFGANLEPAA
jgi:hypothetical protein